MCGLGCACVRGLVFVCAAGPVIIGSVPGRCTAERKVCEPEIDSALLFFLGELIESLG